MRIEDLRTRDADGRRRVEADVVWEDVDLPARPLFFETPADFADDFEASPDAFLLALVTVACWRGESRVRVAGPVCPVMRDNAHSCARILATAYPGLRVPRIEVERGTVPTRPREEPRTGSLMSGGVDALTLLRVNRLLYPLDHPDSIRDCLLVFGLYGFDCDEDGPVPERLRAFEDLRGRLQGLARRQSFTLVPVLTNVRTFSPDYPAWSHALYSPMTVAAAHLCSRRLDTVLFGSEGGGLDSPDVASSQELSQCFSTAALDLRLELVHLDRLERIRLLADWDEGRALVQPCHWVEVPGPGQINCGRCEKCVRTMLGFLLAGRLGETTAFPDDDVTPALIEALPIPSENKMRHLQVLEAPLRRLGRRDLARAIRRRGRRWRRKGR